MMWALALLLVAASCCNALRMTMKVKEARPLVNLPRKIKRQVRSADTADKLNAIFTPENDKFLKELTKEGLRETVLHAISKKCGYLKVPMRKDFGAKAAVKLPTIIEAAKSAGSFSTLLAAVGAAGLTSTLEGGQFTVFAPSDEAFAALEAGTVDGLLADIPKLTAVLTYHVLPTIYKSKKVKKVMEPLATVNGEAKLAVKVDKNDKSVTIGDGAKVGPQVIRLFPSPPPLRSTPFSLPNPHPPNLPLPPTHLSPQLVTVDIMCSNGVIHAIDKVLIPK